MHLSAGFPGCLCSSSEDSKPFDGLLRVPKHVCVYMQAKVRRGAEGVTLCEKEAAGCGSFGSVEECNE